MLSFSPALSELESLNSHRSTLESFGKKLDEKSKNLRSIELLFSAKKADWDAVIEMAEEFEANSDRVIVLTEGLCEKLFGAVHSVCSRVSSGRSLKVEVVSSNIQTDSLHLLAQGCHGKKVSVFVAVQTAPSERLIWCLRVLLAALSKERHPDEVSRRVIITTGPAASEWERWAQSSPYRTLSFPHRCAGRYLFFSEPTALLLSLMGFTPWNFVEGARSFVRQYDKLAEIDDPMFAYAALREVQLAEHHRETLVLPDETFLGFGRWWRILTEDSRRLFAEEVNDAIVWSGPVMRETPAPGRGHWVTEISLDSESELVLDTSKDICLPPLVAEEVADFTDLEARYRRQIDRQREESGYAQPSIRIGLRRRDPFCLGAFFAFFETVVCASHKLAETADSFSLYKPHQVQGAEVSA